MVWLFRFIFLQHQSLKWLRCCFLWHFIWIKCSQCEWVWLWCDCSMQYPQCVKCHVFIQIRFVCSLWCCKMLTVTVWHPFFPAVSGKNSSSLSSFRHLPIAKHHNDSNNNNNKKKTTQAHTVIFSIWFSFQMCLCVQFKPSDDDNDDYGHWTVNKGYDLISLNLQKALSIYLWSCKWYLKAFCIYTLGCKFTGGVCVFLQTHCFAYCRFRLDLIYIPTYSMHIDAYQIELLFILLKERNVCLRGWSALIASPLVVVGCFLHFAFTFFFLNKIRFGRVLQV